ncbi:MAG: electron transfer flavoprotein subunit beta/FixA family protein [Syntrophaceae bacterium]|nr:electron transfer flavoprotein subunit beta/FixA family protein [Syntrophaceae bacterium]
MLHTVVCLKQVPQITELPWNPVTMTLQRDLALGMSNPACRSALEAALQIREAVGGTITAITMGPPPAEEVLREAIALGADKGVLLTDRVMAGADTAMTSHILARAITKTCPKYDLVLCGFATSDSETAQVGPQLAEELGIPGVTYINKIEILNREVRLQRLADLFLETFEMDLPGLVTVTADAYLPRYVPLGGLQAAFAEAEITTLDVVGLDLDPRKLGANGSFTKILNLYAPAAGKKNVVLTGPPKKLAEQLFNHFEDKIGGAIGKDLKADKKRS